MQTGCVDSSIQFPGSHDRTDVANSPRYWGTNGYPVLPTEKEVYIERDKDGDIKTKTVLYPSGRYRIMEYLH
jgi:hypothetical protein